MSDQGHDRVRLERLVRGELDAERERQARNHLEECEDCRRWTETLEHFATALAGEGRGFDHPSSEQLARYLVDPELLTPVERQHLDAHVPSCLPCRKLARLTTQALDEAREPETEPRSRPVGWSARLGLALAAGLVVTLGLSWVLRTPSETTPGPTAQVRFLSNESLRGSRYIAAGNELFADSVIIESDGEVILRAGNSVVISDGFSVSEGGSLSVELGTAVDELDSDTS